MKKSEIYHEIQKVVLAAPLDLMNAETKLKSLRELFQQEDLAKYQEKQEAVEE